MTEPFEIEFEQFDDYLSVSVSGLQDTMEVSKAYWQRIADESAKRGCAKLLVTEDFENQCSTLEMFDLVQYLGRLGLNDKKVAFVDPHLSHLDLNSFGETVAQNMGLHCSVFSDHEEARSWLLAKE